MNLAHLVSQYWWMVPSALYTLASTVWTVRAERALRALRREQRVLNMVYTDLHRDVDDIQTFLENGNTIREIKVIPITRGKVKR